MFVNTTTPRFGHMFKIKGRNSEVIAAVEALGKQAEALKKPFAVDVIQENRPRIVLVMTGQDATDFAIPATQLSQEQVIAWRTQSSNSTIHRLTENMLNQIKAGTSKRFNQLMAKQ